MLAHAADCAADGSACAVEPNRSASVDVALRRPQRVAIQHSAMTLRRREHRQRWHQLPWAKGQSLIPVRLAVHDRVSTANNVLGWPAAAKRFLCRACIN